MEDFIMYDEIFSQITNAANKRNLRDSTIHAYCTSVAHFLKYTDKQIDALTTDDVDTFLTEKRLSGISPETYNHYHSGIRFFYRGYIAFIINSGRIIFRIEVNDIFISI